MLRLVELRKEVRSLERRLGLAADVGASAVEIEETWAYRLLGELGTDMITVHAPTGEYRFASPNIERLFGWRPEQVVGRSAYDFFFPEDLERIANSHVSNSEGDINAVRYRYLCKNGGYRWVETRSRSEERQDGMGQIVCFTRDIHDEVQSQEAAKSLEEAHRAALERMARQDPLVALPNRRAAEETLRRRWTDWRENGEAFCVAFIDVDEVPALRARAGRSAVDEVLRGVARIIERALRPQDFAARWDGATFLLVLSLRGDPSAVADEVRLQVRDARLGPGRDVTVSVGAATSMDAQDMESLRDAADHALSSARARGPGHLRFIEAA